MRRTQSPKPFQAITVKLGGAFDICATQTPRPSVLHNRILRISDAASISSDWRQVGIDIRRSTARAAARVKA